MADANNMTDDEMMDIPNDPKAVEVFVRNKAADGVDPSVALKQVASKGEVPEGAEDPVVDGEAEPEQVGDDAGEDAGTAEDDSPAQQDPDPAQELITARAEAAALRKAMELLPQFLAKQEPVKPAEPAPLPPDVQQLQKLVSIDQQTARAHWEKLTEEGRTFEAGQFQAAWQSAPNHLRDWKEREALRTEWATSRNAEKKASVDKQMSVLSKAHPDWEKYAEKMEDLARRDVIVQQAGLPSAYETIEDLYFAAGGKGGAKAPALNPADAKRKAALGKGPMSRTGSGAGAGRAKTSPEQETIDALMSDDLRV